MEVHVSSDLDNPKSLEMALEYLRLVGQEVCSVDLETVSLACSVCERWTSLPRTPTLTIGEHAIPIGKDLRKDVQKWKEMARIIKKNQLPPMGLKP